MTMLIALRTSDANRMVRVIGFLWVDSIEWRRHAAHMTGVRASIGVRTFVLEEVRP